MSDIVRIQIGTAQSDYGVNFVILGFRHLKIALAIPAFIFIFIFIFYFETTLWGAYSVLGAVGFSLGDALRYRILLVLE